MLELTLFGACIYLEQIVNKFVHLPRVRNPFYMTINLELISTKNKIKSYVITLNKILYYNLKLYNINKYYNNSKKG